MSKVMDKSKKRDAEKAARVIKVAELTGISKRQVYRVLAGDQENPALFELYMALYEGENKLLEAVKQLVPFN